MQRLKEVNAGIRQHLKDRIRGAGVTAACAVTAGAVSLYCSAKPAETRNNVQNDYGVCLRTGKLADCAAFVVTKYSGSDYGADFAEKIGDIANISPELAGIVAEQTVKIEAGTADLRGNGPFTLSVADAVALYAHAFPKQSTYTNIALVAPAASQAVVNIAKSRGKSGDSLVMIDNALIRIMSIAVVDPVKAEATAEGYDAV